MATFYARLSTLRIIDPEAEIARMNAGGESVLLLVDHTQPRVDLANRVLLPSEETLEAEAVSVETITVDGVGVSFGGPGEQWSWDPARQQVFSGTYFSQIVTQPPVEVKWRGRWIATVDSGVVTKVTKVSERRDLGDVSDGETEAAAIVRRSRDVAQVIDATFVPGQGRHVVEGSGATLSRDLIDRLGIRGVVPADVWRVEQVEIGQKGDLLVYSVRLIRVSDAPRYREVWRKVLRDV